MLLPVNNDPSAGVLEFRAASATVSHMTLSALSPNAVPSPSPPPTTTITESFNALRRAAAAAAKVKSLITTSSARAQRGRYARM